MITVTDFFLIELQVKQFYFSYTLILFQFYMKQ